MAYTRTGRPPGRPKTKEYVTLMARVPQDLADQAKRYARLRQQTISEVLRGALESLVEEDRYRPFMSDMNTLSEIVSDMNMTQEHRSAMVQSPAEAEILSDTISTDTVLEILSDMNGEQEIVSDTNITPEAQRSSQRVPVAIDYDRTRYTLGKLCPRGHEWGTTGQSLLQQSNRKCLLCHREQGRIRRQAQRQAQRQAAPVA